LANVAILHTASTRCGNFRLAQALGVVGVVPGVVAAAVEGMVAVAALVTEVAEEVAGRRAIGRARVSAVIETAGTTQSRPAGFHAALTREVFHALSIGPMMVGREW
jgi:hypothetical protein